MKIINSKNIYGIPDSQIAQIIDIIDFYTELIINEEVSQLSLPDSLGELEVLAEAIPVILDKHVAIDKSYEILEHINQKFISTGKYRGCSLYDGLPNLGRIISRLYDNTGYYLHVKNSLDKTIYEQTKSNSLFCINNFTKVNTEHFDVIQGVAGSLAYILEYTDFRNVCEEPLNFLNLLSEELIYNGKTVPGWFLKTQNITNKDYLESYKDGYINYSLSHGSGGIFAVLNIAHQKGIMKEEIEKTLKYIYSEYINTSSKYGVNFFSGIIDVNDYHKMKIQNNRERQSWCYGSASILYHVMLAGMNMNNKIMLDNAVKILKNESKKEFGLFSPIICHGYAGTMTVFRKIFELLEDDIVQENMTKLLHKVLNSYNPNLKFGFIDTIFKPINGKLEEIKEEKKDFLTGTSGIVLSLLAFITNTKFENALLLS